MKRYGNNYQTVPRCVERLLKWTGYKIHVKKETGFECPWDEKTPYDHFRYRVTVSRPGNSTWFYFWGSVAEYQENGNTGAGEMIARWVSNREYGLIDFEDFCSEMGYSTDSISALKTWKACRRITKTAERMFSDRIISALEYCAYNL